MVSGATPSKFNVDIGKTNMTLAANCTKLEPESKRLDYSEEKPSSLDTISGGSNHRDYRKIEKEDNDHNE